MNNSRLITILQLKEHPLKFSDLFKTAGKFGMDENQMSLLAEVSLRTFKTKSKTSLLSFRISERVKMLNHLYQIGHSKPLTQSVSYFVDLHPINPSKIKNLWSQ